MTDNYLNEEICAACGGKCCKRQAGACHPGDFDTENLEAALVQAFESGHYVIDWWEGDPRDLGRDDEGCVDRGFYVRPRNDEDYRYQSLYCPSWGGKCCFLTLTGCALEPEARPTTCRMLEPRADGECELHAPGGKLAAALAWLPFHDVIKQAARKARKL